MNEKKCYKCTTEVKRKLILLRIMSSLFKWGSIGPVTKSCTLHLISLHHKLLKYVLKDQRRQSEYTENKILLL